MCKIYTLVQEIVEWTFKKIYILLIENEMIMIDNENETYDWHIT